MQPWLPGIIPGSNGCIKPEISTQTSQEYLWASWQLKAGTLASPPEFWICTLFFQQSRETARSVEGRLLLHSLSEMCLSVNNYEIVFMVLVMSNSFHFAGLFEISLCLFVFFRTWAITHCTQREFFGSKEELCLLVNLSLPPAVMELVLTISHKANVSFSHLLISELALVLQWWQTHISSSSASYSGEKGGVGPIFPDLRTSSLPWL